MTAAASGHDAIVQTDSSRPQLDGWWVSVWVLYDSLAVVYTSLGLWRYQIFRAGQDDGTFLQILNDVT